jgi:GNAT superfamily N-acetyltransferase
MVSIPGYDIRYSTVLDVVWLEKWLASPGMLHWFPMSPGRECDESVQNWIGFSRYYASITAVIDDTPCGIGTLFLMPYRKVAHECLFKLVVDPEKQRQGIGRSLIRNLMHLAKNRFHMEFMITDLVEGNPLEHLLVELGFQKIVRQERFFKEDGRYFARILMERDLREWKVDGE